MIVHTTIGEYELPDATRYVTDQANNLEVMGGAKGDKPLLCVARGVWTVVEVED